MATKLTKAQVENLKHVQRFGEAKPRSASGYWCRTHGLSEFVLLLADGGWVTITELEAMPKPLKEGHELVRAVGERLTPAGLSALKEHGDESND